MKKIAWLLSGVLLAGVMFPGCSIIPDNTTASSDSTFNSILAKAGPSISRMFLAFPMASSE